MTDIEFFEDERASGAGQHGVAAPAGTGASRVGLLVNWAGAVVSLGLVVGMGVWAYQLTMRDVSGVPVIRALEGPMRVPPADPGGVQAEHQGLAVNRLAEGEEAGPVPDRLVLAPPPIDLDEVELASSSVGAPIEEAAASIEADTAPGTGVAVARAASLPTPAAASAETRALIERLIARSDPLSGLDEPDAAAAADAEVIRVSADAEIVDAPADPAPAIAIEVIPATVPGVARSLRPALRPAAMLQSRPAGPAIPVATGPVDMDPDALVEGTRLVQLGAFDTPELAMAEWDRLLARFPDFFDGRARVIQEANSGGSAFYRLRAHGFEDLAASRRFCAALMAQNAPCIPVTVR